MLDLPTVVRARRELAVSQPAGTITGTPLTIGNTGTAALAVEHRRGTGRGPDAALSTVDPKRQDLLRDGVLLVPNTGAPRAWRRSTRETGDLLDPAFITYPQSLGTTTHIILNAAQDGFLVSSQSENVVHAFDLDGAYQGVFAPIGGAEHRRSWATSAA